MDPIKLVERLGRWSSGRGPLYVLLAGALRALIDEGELAPGAALPPDRLLARDLNVGRSTVVAAYDLLMTEGRIVRRQGSGTRVAGNAAGGLRETTSAPFLLHLLDDDEGVLHMACAAPEAPPVEVATAYERATQRLFSSGPDIGYHPYGHPLLRERMAERYSSRGIPTGPEQIIITTGAQQALSLLARALVRPGAQVLIEAPTYPGAIEVLREESAVLRTLPVGLPNFAVAAKNADLAAAYVIPTYHNPTGSVLPALMRQRLAEEADAAGVPLIDDEVLADLGFPGEPPHQSLAAFSDSVISIGSLSKVVWGGLRIGWIRASTALIARLGRLRAVHDMGGDMPTQLAAAELVPLLDELQVRTSAVREERHDHLRAELARHLPDWTVPPVRGGQTLWIELPYGTGASFAQTALRHQVTVLAGSGLDASGGSHEFVRVQFMAPLEELTEGVRRLSEAWSAYRPPREVVGTAPVMAI